MPSSGKRSRNTIVTLELVLFVFCGRMFSQMEIIVCLTPPDDLHDN